jgi:hypothetical protein
MNIEILQLPSAFVIIAFFSRQIPLNTIEIKKKGKDAETSSA